MSSYYNTSVGFKLIILLHKSIKSKEPSKEQCERQPWSKVPGVDTGHSKPTWHVLPSVTSPSSGTFPHMGPWEVGAQPRNKTLPLGLSFPSRLWNLRQARGCMYPAVLCHSAFQNPLGSGAPACPQVREPQTSFQWLPFLSETARINF